MSRGRIEQRGTPEEVYDAPATAFVHGFVGTTLEVRLPLAIEAIPATGIKTNEIDKELLVK